MGAAAAGVAAEPVVACGAGDDPKPAIVGVAAFAGAGAGEL